MNNPVASDVTPLDASAVRRVQRWLADLRRTEEQLRAVLEVGNLAAARRAADLLSQQATELSAALGNWPTALSVFRVGDCPDCGGPLHEYNSAALGGPAFRLCSACGHDFPAPRTGFYASLDHPDAEQMGAYVFADEVLPAPQGMLAVVAARSPADAARHFEHLTQRALTLTREPTEPSPHWYFLCWDGLAGSSAPRPIQARWLRPLSSGEEVGQVLDTAEWAEPGT
ncbi:hypothetical protein [Deinococcus alpinitundrae]|uniref:hypothetical protein n=1 Tax=Deinococcus alpinitundrae TaxID=468913 RepID=UPI001379872E|nr:hypothetical protein [Deinococcus alpinitundrae]